MLIYDINSLEQQIKYKKEILENNLKYHVAKRKCLLAYTLKITDCINEITTIDDTTSLFEFIDDLKCCLNLINSNIDNLNLLISDISNLDLQIKEHSMLETNLENYNSIYANLNTTIMNNLVKVENIFQDFSSFATFDFSEKIKHSSSQAEIPPLENETIEKSKFSDNNILLISEIKNKVFLPYLIKDLELKLKDSPNKYTSIEDIINKEYIIPLERYSNSTFARFREAFNLMRYKEKASIIRSLDLASELCFKQTLNPAVISACKNIDELDIYLDLLDENDLENFKIFNIQFEFAPFLK